MIERLVRVLVLTTMRWRYCWSFVLAGVACATSRTSPPTTIVTPQNRADSMALAIAIYTAAFTNATRYTVAPDLVCVKGTPDKSDPPSEVITALQANRTLLIRANSACTTDLSPDLSTTHRSLVVDTLTGKRGISISATDPVFHQDGTFTMSTEYYQHYRSAGGWQCRGKRRSDGSWEITKCTMVWVS